MFKLALTETAIAVLILSSAATAQTNPVAPQNQTKDKVVRDLRAEFDKIASERNVPSIAVSVEGDVIILDSQIFSDSDDRLVFINARRRAWGEVCKAGFHKASLRYRGEDFVTYSLGCGDAKELLSHEATAAPFPNATGSSAGKETAEPTIPRQQESQDKTYHQTIAPDQLAMASVRQSATLPACFSSLRVGSSRVEVQSCLGQPSLSQDNQTKWTWQSEGIQITFSHDLVEDVEYVGVSKGKRAAKRAGLLVQPTITSGCISIRDITFYPLGGWDGFARGMFGTPYRRLMTAEIDNYCGAEVRVRLYARFYASDGQEIANDTWDGVVWAARKTRCKFYGQPEFANDPRAPVTGRLEAYVNATR